MDDYDDEEIAIRLLCGAEEGIDQLVQKYGRRVANVLRKKFPDVPDDDRMLALRHAAYKAVRSVATFDDKKAPIHVWFTTIAINCVIDMLRDGRTDFHKDIKGEIESIADERAPKPFGNEAESAPNVKVLEALEQSIDELPEQLKRVVTADLQAGGKAHSADLAESLGVGQGTIRQYRKRYREALYESMRKKGFAEIPRRAS